MVMRVLAPDPPFSSSNVTVVDKPHRPDVFAFAGVTIDDALRRHDVFVGDAVLIIATVGAVHDKAPDAARPHVEARRCRGETIRAPPLRQMLGIGHM